MFAFVDNRRRRFTRHPVVALLIGSAFLILLLAAAVSLAACGGPANEDATTGSTPETDAVSPSSDTGSLAADRAALVAFYNAMDGDNWTNNENWLTDAPLDQWHGVGTNSDGRVFHLRLTDNQLTGELPMELAALSFLIVLGATDNQLSGKIPPELGNLIHLATLELGGNQLSGEIPRELGNLPRLQNLDLAGNQLGGEIPPELGSLSRLEGIYLNGNQLSGEIPRELGNLPRLQNLDLAGNQLGGEIPPELGSLSMLEGMYLDGNPLAGCIPEGLREIQNSDLDLTGLPFCGSRTISTDSPTPEATRPWEETVEFSVGDYEPYFIEIPVEKCWFVVIGLQSDSKVEVSYDGPTEHGGATWGQVTKLDSATVGHMTDDGTLKLEVRGRWGQTTRSNVTVSYRRSPPRFEC